MKFRIERSLVDNVFSTKTLFEAYGKSEGESFENGKVISTISAELEKKLIDDFGIPNIMLGGEFKGKAKLNEGKLEVKLYDEELLAEGEEVISFSLIEDKSALCETFSASYSADANKQEKYMVDGEGSPTTKFNKYQFSEAKCLIFEKEIANRIKIVLDELRSKQTQFEDLAPEHFEV